MDLFLDANAHLPLSQAAIKALIDFNSSMAGHGHAMSSSKPGRDASSAIEIARTKIAKLIGAESSEQIIFTSTCTQACEWGANLLKRKFNKIYLSQIEHPAIKHPIRNSFVNIIDLTVNREGMVSCEFPIEDGAVVCLHVQPEIGTIQPIQNIQAPLFCDFSQSIGRIPVDFSLIPNLEIGVFGAHKFGGPTIGFMYIRDINWWQSFGTGSRYFMDRPGTPDASSIVAAAAALEDATRTLQKRYDNMLRFRTVLEAELEDIGLEVIGKGGTRLPNTTFVRVGRQYGSHLISVLETEGIHIGLGSACGGLVVGSSPLMSALGYGGNVQDFVRVSQFGNYGEAEGRFVAAAFRKYCPKKEYIA